MKGAVRRCFWCDTMVSPSDIQKGGCQECGSRRTRMAAKITDAEEARLVAEGYEFDQDDWSDTPSEGEALAYREKGDKKYEEMPEAVIEVTRD